MHTGNFIVLNPDPELFLGSGIICFGFRSVKNERADKFKNIGLGLWNFFNVK